VVRHNSTGKRSCHFGASFSGVLVTILSYTQCAKRDTTRLLNTMDGNGTKKETETEAGIETLGTGTETGTGAKKEAGIKTSGAGIAAGVQHALNSLLQVVLDDLRDGCGKEALRLLEDAFDIVSRCPGLHTYGKGSLHNYCDVCANINADIFANANADATNA
jgi:hypothetical protein